VGCTASIQLTRTISNCLSLRGPYYSISIHQACTEILLGTLQVVAHERDYTSNVRAQVYLYLFNENVRLDGQLINPQMLFRLWLQLKHNMSRGVWDVWEGLELCMKATSHSSSMFLPISYGEL